MSSMPEPLLEPIQRGTLQYSWRGIPCLKNPFDLALYSLLLWRLRPKTIIEVGSNAGGSAVWFADIMQAFGLDGQVISVDINRPQGVSHDKVEFRKGDALDLGATFSQEELERLPRPWLIVEDASHDFNVSLACLNFFGPKMRAGEYICVEDGIISSFRVEERYRGGPTKAIAEFLSINGDAFVIDSEFCDYFGYNVTWNTNGFLKCVRRASE